LISLYWNLQAELTYDNSPPFITTLSSRLKVGNLSFSSSMNSHVASVGDNPCQWTKTYVAAYWPLLTILQSMIFWGCNKGSFGPSGKLLCTTLFLTLLFNRDIWKIKWMVGEDGRFSLYVTSPILLITVYGP
jgi:hypothetical protein